MSMMTNTYYEKEASYLSAFYWKKDYLFYGVFFQIF